ncbi:hypothetical protein BDK51DRAFT_38396 [Blyttiomyces helicus]|uniref:Uncharacterized protein n=1 Tax=Blyttiomyces helicus TaxID=388810 RepID=A0A4P9VZC5_9FUNG|nr:hypothetical protein BDK51DRAFT_38396 [Blyttiomyces helicus]|eukprot:RKO83166.1 hypothetical protein BDK51DRAFT_38396 [Blyttiomyces helicus]
MSSGDPFNIITPPTMPLAVMNLTTLVWIEMRNMSLPPLSGHTLTIVGDSAYVIGGSREPGPSATIHEIPLSPSAPNATGTQPSVGGSAPRPMTYPCSALLGSDSILVFGGAGTDPHLPKQPNADTFIFNIPQLAPPQPVPAWTSNLHPQLPAPRHCPTPVIAYILNPYPSSDVHVKSADSTHHIICSMNRDPAGFPPILELLDADSQGADVGAVKRRSSERPVQPSTSSSSRETTQTGRLRER